MSEPTRNTKEMKRFIRKASEVYVTTSMETDSIRFQVSKRQALELVDRGDCQGDENGFCLVMWDDNTCAIDSGY